MNPKQPQSPHHSARAVEAYDHIVDRLRERLDAVGSYSWDYLQQQLEDAAESERATSDLDDAELDQVKSYINRDLAQMGYYLHETGAGIAAWLKFDLNLLERKVMERLLSLADTTRVDYQLLTEQLNHDDDQYVAGEITAPGTLQCTGCGATQTLHRTAIVLPCEKCGSALFSRRAGFAGAKSERK